LQIWVRTKRLEDVYLRTFPAALRLSRLLQSSHGREKLVSTCSPHRKRTTRPMAEFGKVLLLFGVVLAATGLVLILLGRTNLPLGRLPGDFLFRGKTLPYTFRWPLRCC